MSDTEIVARRVDGPGDEGKESSQAPAVDAFREWCTRKDSAAAETKHRQRRARAAALGLDPDRESVATLDTEACVLVRYRRDLDRRQRAHEEFERWVARKDAQAKPEAQLPTDPPQRGPLPPVPRCRGRRRSAPVQEQMPEHPLAVSQVPTSLKRPPRANPRVERSVSSSSSSRADSRLERRVYDMWAREVETLMLLARSVGADLARSSCSDDDGASSLAASSGSPRLSAYTVPKPRQRARVPIVRTAAPDKEDATPTVDAAVHEERGVARGATAMRLLKSPLAGVTTSVSSLGSDVPRDAALAEQYKRLHSLAREFDRRGLLELVFPHSRTSPQEGTLVKRLMGELQQRVKDALFMPE
jgi:hypothetical protein